MTRHCEHVKSNGRFCGSPAMRGRNYCHFHLVHIGRQLRKQRYAALGLGHPPLELPLLEDAASIQLALMQVTEALLDGSLDPKTAGLVLYSLQTAAINLRTMQEEAEDDADSNTAICNRYDSFEEDYELGDVAELRIEDAADKAEVEAAEKARALLQSGIESDAAGKMDEVTNLIARGEKMGFLNTKGVCWPRKADDDGHTDGPVRVTDREPEDRRVRIPLNLTEMQYFQAKGSIEEYEERHNIDAEHPKGRKPAPQRAAISQKFVLRQRKPVVSATVEEGWRDLAAGS